MKKLIPLLFASVLLDSCEKEYCWLCEVSSKITGTVIKTEEICNKTEKEIEELEKNFPDFFIYTMKCVRYMK